MEVVSALDPGKKNEFQENAFSQGQISEPPH